MATNGGANLRVRISADLADIKQGLGLLRGELAKVKADAARAAPDTGAWTTGIGKIRQELGNLAGAYVGIQTITSGIGALFAALDRADRIGELAVQAGTSTEALSKLAYGAQFSGVGIESLADALNKLSRGLPQNEELIKSLGITTRDALDPTRFRDTGDVVLDLADYFQRLGTGPQQAALAVKLFGKSASDLLPFLIEGRQALEDYGKQAEATGQVIGGPAADAAGEFNDNLDRLKGTIAGVANETIKNLVPGLAAYARTAVGAAEGSNAAAESGVILGNALKGIVFAAILVKNAVEAATNVVAFLGTIATEVSGFLTSGLIKSLGLVVNAAKGLASGRNPLLVFTDTLKASAAGAGQASAAWDGVKASIGRGYGVMSDGLASARSDVADAFAIFDGAAKKADAGSAGMDAAARKAAAAAAAARAAVEALLNGSGGSGAGTDKGGTEKKVEQLAASTELARDQITRAMEDIKSSFDTGDLSAADYYRQRVTLQQQYIDLQLQELQSQLALIDSKSRQRDIEEQIAILQRDRAQVAKDAAAEQKKAEAEANKRKQDDINTRLSGITGGLSSTEQSVSAQVSAGTLGVGEGDRRLADIRQKSLQQLIDLRAAQVAYMASVSDPEQLAAAEHSLNSIDEALANVKVSQRQFRQGVQDSASGALGGLFDDLIDGSKSFSQAFGDMVRSFLAGVAQMIAQKLALASINAIMSSFGGGSTGGVTVGAAHGGGIAGSLRLHRNNISPMVFGAAPRYHGGGVAGLQNDEIPAILKRGEIVRTRQQEAALQARMNVGQGGNAQPVRNIIVFSDDELADAMSGAAGEKVIVNHVRRNRGGIGG